MTKGTKITNAQVYSKYPFLYRAVEYVEDEKHDDEEEPPAHGKPAGTRRKKKKRKNFNFGFESTKEIEIDELMKIFKDSPFQFNYYVTKEIFDAFLADEKNPEFVDIRKLRDLLEDMGLASFNDEEDLKILVEALDKDKDGKLSYKDLLYNIPYHSYSPSELEGFKKYMHADQVATQKSPTKKVRDKIHKREATCCIVNPEMLSKR